MFILQDRFSGFIEDVPDAQATERILQGAYVLGHVEEAVTGPREDAMRQRARQPGAPPSRREIETRRYLAHQAANNPRRRRT